MSTAFLLTLCVMSEAHTLTPLEKSINPSMQHTAWVAEKWSIQDKNFVIIETQVKRKVEMSHDTVALASMYGKLFQKNPKDAFLLFKWGLATFYVAETKQMTWFPKDSDLLLGYLDTVPSPHSLQYDRMRFLVQSRFRGEGFVTTPRP